jgi:hypothetical protein
MTSDEPAATTPDAGAASPAMPPSAAKPAQQKPPANKPAVNDHRPLVPSLSQARLLGPLVGPGSKQADGLQLYGTDMGLTFEHDGRLTVLFGDTWNSADSICDGHQPQQDDTTATMPATWDGKVPQLKFVTMPDAKNTPAFIHVYRGQESLQLGYGQAPIAGFSDGPHAYTWFERLEPALCGDATSASANGSAACVPGSRSFCSSDLGLCQPDILSFPVPCDTTNAYNCLPGQTCVKTSMCIDPTSTQYDDGNFGGKTSALTYETELGLKRDDGSADYDSILTWHTNKFSQPTARTVSKWTGKSADNDYRPGHDALLVWGRPGVLAEQGRQAGVYLMEHRLPLELDAAGKLKFAPKFFAGLDAQGEPRWSEREDDAQPLALDGNENGDPYEEIAVISHTGIAYLPPPVDRWMMMYGGDLADYLLLDPTAARGPHAPGSIMVRFAEHPWGPWSKPIAHLSPGDSSKVGDPYGPGGFLYDPTCVSREGKQCMPSDPHRPLDSAVQGCPFAIPDPGRLYAPDIIDSYTHPNGDGGLDIEWVVSTWNPYGVQLFTTSVGNKDRAAPPADEVADADALARMSDWQALPRLTHDVRRYEQQSSHDRGSEDFSFPLSNHGNRDYNNFICASQDAVLPADQFAPFKLDLPQCAEDYVHGVVLGRFEGSGQMVRMWLGMQSLLDGPPDDEILRIYVDDAPEPKIEVPLAAAIDGSAGEIFAPPFGAGSPHRLAWYYPVAFRKKLIVALDKLGSYDNYFYHCDVSYDAAHQSDPLPRQRLDARDDARRQLSATYRPAGKIGALRDSEALQLSAAETSSFALDGPATIDDFRVRVASSQLAQLAQVQLRVQWDDSEDAAIQLPLLDLFAATPTPPEQSTPAITSFADADAQVLSLKLPMPFAKRARFTFQNAGAFPVSFDVRVQGEHAIIDGPLGYLHTDRRETDAPTTATEHVAVQASGRGRLVGVCGFVQGHADPAGGIQSDPLNLLEGDVRATVDGALALDGTGTEEYTDDVFYFTDAPHARAFEEAWGRQDDSSSSPIGKASFCRWHVLGTELDFQHQLELSFELGGSGNPQIMERIKTVAFYYRRD